MGANANDDVRKEPLGKPEKEDGKPAKKDDGRGATRPIEYLCKQVVS